MVIFVNAGAELFRRSVEGVLISRDEKDFMDKRVWWWYLPREMRDENEFHSLKVSGYRAAAGIVIILTTMMRA